MVGRQPGSGLANASAAAIEELLAAALLGDDAEIGVQRELLAYECSIDRCGMEPDLIVRLVTQAVAMLDLEVTDAVAQPLDGLGDVRASLRDGAFVWFRGEGTDEKGPLRRPDAGGLGSRRDGSSPMALSRRPDVCSTAP